MATPRMKALEAKVVVLGREGVGKTSIVVRYVGKIFSRNVSPTVGASFFTFKMTVDNHRVKLMLWDTAGQERFRSMAPMYYRKANAAFLVYDITQYSTFENMKTWAEELKKAVDTPIVMCVLGNKCDLKEQRKVAADEALMYAASIGALFFETSALTNEGVQEAFLRLSLALISLSKSAPNCGLVTKDYDSRRKSVDLVSFPPNLKLLREQIKREEMPEEDEEEEDDNTTGRCC
ncbi:ras-related protein Rab-22A-like [Asterias amurensis]|uniref:ras-related protein Rab-22A-like n=1 Tax=Asterias amurensis TaxID=7602 RepID=UPI003AB27067